LRRKKIKTKGCVISVQDACAIDQLGELAGFRQRFFDCLTARADALFELCDAVLCSDGPVVSLPELSLAVEHRRGHGALYDSLNHGLIDVGKFRNVVASQPIPRCDDGRIVLAIDVSNWLRPDAATSPDRLFCHTYGRGKGQAQMIPGWPYSFVAVLEPGRTSWTAILGRPAAGSRRRGHRRRRSPTAHGRRPAHRGRALEGRRPRDLDRGRHRI
jgi:hypothetical protein